MAGEITGEIIKSAISRNIRQNITLKNSATYKIYKERTVQGFAKPSFFIWAIDVEQQSVSKGVYNRIYQMNIRYHTQDSTPKLNEELNELGNKLLYHLAILDVPILDIDETTQKQKEITRPVKGTQMSFNIVEDVLQVYVTYTIRVKQSQTTQPNMVDVKII